ncbi:MAG: hypothetical protein WB763_21165 [Terriglobia bacterium]|jgi:hypothetical protein
MRGSDLQTRRAFRRGLILAAAIALLWAGGGLAVVALPPQEIPADATPQVQQLNPSQAAPGEEVTIVVEGQNFSPGAYVSFTNPSIHVVSTRRVSGTELEVKLAISKKAQAGAISLYVSNPASIAAEAEFTIAPAAVPAPAAPAAPSTPAEEVHPSESSTPEVTSVAPPRAAPRTQASLKITGKNFAQGAKVSFLNPGIRVLETTATATTELTVRIQITADAPTGKTSLFVVNPDDKEAEAPFEVAGGTTKAAAVSEPASSAGQRFDVYNLGDVASLLQSHNKTKGTLMVTGQKLTYEESGKEVFSTPLSDIREVDANIIPGLNLNTGTFHINLTSGKTYNFIAGSLRPADSQSIVDSLRKAIH